MDRNNLDQTLQNPSQENIYSLTSESSEVNVSMPIVMLAEISTKPESSSGSRVVNGGIGIEPKSLESIIYRILVEADQPLWIDEIIDSLKEEMAGIQFTREYLLPILTTSSLIRTYSPYALFAFIPSVCQRNTKTKKKIQKSKSNLNSNWDKWFKKDSKISEVPTKENKNDSENEVDNKRTNKASVTEETPAEKTEIKTTKDMDNSDKNINIENTPKGMELPKTPLLPSHQEEETEIESHAGEEISRWTDDNGRTFIFRVADPSELTEEEREWLEKAEHDRLTKTPDQELKDKARATKRKEMGEGTTRFVTSLKTRGSKKTVSIDKKSWGSLFDE